MPALFPTTPEGASAGAELVTSDGRALALTGARLVGEAQGGLARLVLEQTFANHDAEVLKVTYRMPLPADGAVSGYEFVIGERTVRGVVDKKQRARERFETAIASGHTAALLEQERADIFTQQIGNIAAGETIVARITIDQRLAWLPEGEWELRFPTVIGPRYIGTADTIQDAKATHVKVSDRPLPIHFQIEIAIRDAITGGAKPSSPSHTLTKQGDVVALASGTRLDRDIVVRWPVAAAAPGLALNVARRPAGDAFGLVTIVPPARAVKATPVARDLLVLLDTSGSMGGGPLDKAKQVVALMIDSLGERDRLELIEFSNEPRRWKDEPIEATGKAKQEAIKWVRSREANGGTEMRRAVIESLATLRIGAQRQVLLVTDGYVGGEQQILEALHRKLPQSCRLHVLGVGSAVNRSLATALSRAGRGAEVIVGIDEDAERGAKRLLDRTKLPMLTNVELSGSALLRHAPEKIPDVFENAPLVAALALNPDGGELIVKGQVADDSWVQRITVPAQRVGEGNQAIAALYGRERVADVEAHGMFDSVNGEIEELGLMFQIATKLTSWIAVDESRVVKGPGRDELVPQELPYGTSAQAFGLRPASGFQTESADRFDMSYAPAPAMSGYPPPPMGAPMGGMARGRFAGPPPGRPSGVRTRSVPVADDDAFGEEEATGQHSLEKKESDARPPRPTESVPFAMNSARAMGPTTPVPQQMPKPAPVTKPRTETGKAIEDQIQGLAPRVKPPTNARTRWIWYLALAAFWIAVLLWWLLA